MEKGIKEHALRNLQEGWRHGSSAGLPEFIPSTTPPPPKFTQTISSYHIRGIYSPILLV
jgi:hypothetical protein